LKCKKITRKSNMKFFIDTANLAEIREANDMGILDGVTTNPSLMAKEGITGANNILNHYVQICNIVDGPVSAEVIATDFEGMVREGEALAELHPNIVVKIPMITEGIKAIKYFSQKGIPTNCTLIFSAGTEILAASIRHPMHIIHCASIGADVMTGPLSAIKALAKHPLTDIGLQQFLADHAKGNK